MILFTAKKAKKKKKNRPVPLGEFLGLSGGVGPDSTVVSAPKVKYDDEDREGKHTSMWGGVFCTSERTSMWWGREGIM